MKTLGSSLFVGSTLNMFMKHPRLEIATLFKLTAKGFMGWIGNKGQEFTATAPYLAFQLYKSTVGGDVIETQVDSATYSSWSIGVVDAVKDVPLVDALTVRNGDQLLLYVVNKSFDKNVETEISIDGLLNFTQLTTTVLTGSSIDAHTGTELPRIPGINWAPQVVVSRFNQGGPQEISLTTTIEPASFQIKGSGPLIFMKTFPRLSITRLQLSDAKGASPRAPRLYKITH